MTSHDDELSRNMDRITQLQDGIDNLVTIMYSTLSYLSRKADFKKINPDIPITQSIPDSTKPNQAQETFAQNCQELVDDFICTAKQLQYLISILPPHESFSDASRATGTAQSASNGPSNGHPAAPQVLTSPPGSSPPNHAAEGAHPPPHYHGDTNENDLGADREEFLRLQSDIEGAQAEYEQALSIAESLHQEIKTVLRVVLDKRSQPATGISILS